MADRVQQVRLAQTGVAVDEQRVVRLARCLGHSHRGSVREPVGGADDEGLEGVLGVEPGLQGAGSCGVRADVRPVEARLALLRSGAAERVASRVAVLGQVTQPAVREVRAVGHRHDVGPPRICRHVVLMTCRLVRRRRRVVLQGRVHRHRDPDLPMEAHAQRVLELGSEPTLELAAGEVVGDRDDGGALVQRDRFARPEPGPLVGLELLDDAAPHGVQVHRFVLHVSPSRVVLVTGPSYDGHEGDRPGRVTGRSSLHNFIHRCASCPIRPATAEAPEVGRRGCARVHAGQPAFPGSSGPGHTTDPSARRGWERGLGGQEK